LWSLQAILRGPAIVLPLHRCVIHAEVQFIVQRQSSVFLQTLELVLRAQMQFWS
jgi:hypothetical protein